MRRSIQGDEGGHMGTYRVMSIADEKESKGAVVVQ